LYEKMKRLIAEMEELEKAKSKDQKSTTPKKASKAVKSRRHTRYDSTDDDNSNSEVDSMPPLKSVDTPPTVTTEKDDWGTSDLSHQQHSWVDLGGNLYSARPLSKRTRLAHAVTPRPASAIS
jgi:hypothetical protein